MQKTPSTFKYFHNTIFLWAGDYVPLTFTISISCHRQQFNHIKDLQCKTLINFCVQSTKFTNPIMHLSHISQCTILNTFLFWLAPSNNLTLSNWCAMSVVRHPVPQPRWSAFPFVTRNCSITASHRLAKRIWNSRPFPNSSARAMFRDPAVSSAICLLVDGSYSKVYRVASIGGSGAPETLFISFAIKSIIWLKTKDSRGSLTCCSICTKACAFLQNH